MTRYNVALLSLLASTASAVPHYGQYNHHHPAHPKPSAHPTGGFSSSMPSGYSPSASTGGAAAPYPAGNSTAVAPTGSAPVTSSVSIYTTMLPEGPTLSTVTVVPEPLSSSSADSPVESNSGVDNSPVDNTSVPAECGPATVTVTSANTVTVTVGGDTESSAAVESPVPTVEESSMEAISHPTSKPVEIESPSVAHPVPMETGTPEHAPEDIPKEDAPKEDTPKEDSPKDTAEETPKDTQEDTEDSSEAPDTTSDAGEFYEAPTPEEPATSSSAESPQEGNSEETPEDTEDAPKTPIKPSTDNVVSRGLVYNEASLTSKFDSASTGWLYNWDSAPGGEVNGAKEFVPMLWNTSEVYHTPNWASDVENAVAAGTKHILAFNEPDLPAQANMNVGQSVDGWNKYIEPLHEKYNGDLKLGSPSVCNGPEQNMGLQYL
ncbi:MAG: hypothetical protein Q9174_000391, partial [Haloplaca sp. 1 TL-2023]